MLDIHRPQDVAVPAGIVRPTACACARRRQGASLRSAPRYRRAHGLDAGSAHARPGWLLSDDAQSCPLHGVVDDVSTLLHVPTTVDTSRKR